jgi:hypothetical protein
MIARFAAVLIATATLAACAGDSDSRRPASTPTAAPASSPEASPEVVSNCLAAVADEVRNSDVSVIRTEVAEGDGTHRVYVDVPGAEAPWLCTATFRGSVESVMYTGSEGAL